MSKLFLAFMLLTLIVISGCESSTLSQTPDEPQVSDAIPTPTPTPSPSPAQVDEHKETEYIRISPQEAQEILSENVIILDVRNQGEYDLGHIRNAILLPHTEIRERAESVIPDKDQIILVYCRAGSRSEFAARELIDMGYTQVFDFGGIADWTGEIITDATNGR